MRGNEYARRAGADRNEFRFRLLPREHSEQWRPNANGLQFDSVIRCRSGGGLCFDCGFKDNLVRWVGCGFRFAVAGVRGEMIERQMMPIEIG